MGPTVTSRSVPEGVRASLLVFENDASAPKDRALLFDEAVSP